MIEYEIALKVMKQKDPSLAEKYAKVIEFLVQFPGFVSKRHTKNPIGSKPFIESQAEKFVASRKRLAPTPPSTVPDEMVSLILVSYFEIDPSQTEKIKYEHQLSMGAENIVGNLLERYLASVMEENGWIWCSGEMVTAVDFIKPPLTPNGEWSLLQVKNRDNTENSSSSAIRKGTNIQKWFRTFSKKEGANWANFPDLSLRSMLSEQGFRIFVERYLEDL